VSLPPLPAFIFEVHRPRRESVLAVTRYIQLARNSGHFPAESPGGMPAAVAIQKLATDSGALRFLSEHMKPGARESKRGVREHLVRLQKALTDFISATSELRQLLGSELYDGVGGREIALLDSVYDRAGAEAPAWTASNGEVLPDPLEWASMNQPTSLRQSKAWAERALATVSSAIHLIAKPGADRGSPEMFFARDAFDTWLALAFRPGAPIKLPARKQLAGWFEIAFEFAEHATGQDHNNLARRLIDSHRALMRAGQARSLYPG